MHEFLTFTLAGETCAVSIDHVESVLHWSQLTSIPGAPSYVRGLLNLRGEAIPVVDVRDKLGLPRLNGPEEGSIIVMCFQRGNGKKLVRALVDAVCEVIELLPEEISPTDSFAVHFNQEVVLGIGTKYDQFISVMAVEAIFAREEYGEQKLTVAQEA